MQRAYPPTDTGSTGAVLRLMWTRVLAWRAALAAPLVAEEAGLQGPRSRSRDALFSPRRWQPFGTHGVDSGRSASTRLDSNAFAEATPWLARCAQLVAVAVECGAFRVHVSAQPGWEQQTAVDASRATWHGPRRSQNAWTAPEPHRGSLGPRRRAGPLRGLSAAAKQRGTPAGVAHENAEKPRSRHEPWQRA
jgi:hypothetical protein